MSSDDASKPRPPVAWKTIDLVADQAEREEMEQLLAMSDEELDADLMDAGFAPEDAANLVKAALANAPAPAPAPAKVLSLANARNSRARSVRWFPLVAAAAAVAILGAGGATYVAVRSEETAPTSPVPAPSPSPPQPSPEMLARQSADAQRRDAVAKCSAHKWSDCADELAAADKADPGGATPASRRMVSKAERSARLEQIEGKMAPPGGRTLPPDDRARLVAALAPRAGQAVRLVCGHDGEAQRYCTQLAAAMTKAGWVVTRETAARDAGMRYGIAVTVAEGSDDATEDAAEALAAGLEQGLIHAVGPDDAPRAAGDGPAVTLTVGSL